MSHRPIKRITALIAIVLLTGCTLSPVKKSVSITSETQVATHDLEKGSALKMFVFQKAYSGEQKEQAGYIVEFEPKITENADKSRSVLIYKD